MALEDVTAHDALLSRADQAIAIAAATRAEVQAGLIAAGRKIPCRPWAGEARPSKPIPLDPLPPCMMVDPWWSMARTLVTAHAIVRAADEELERSWRRALLTLETPLNLFQEGSGYE